MNTGNGSLKRLKMSSRNWDPNRYTERNRSLYNRLYWIRFCYTKERTRTKECEDDIGTGSVRWLHSSHFPITSFGPRLDLSPDNLDLSGGVG